jgi:hypothetical protein
MMHYMRAGGVPMVPLVIIAFVVIGLTFRSWWRLRSNGGSSPAVVETGIDAVLFWGVYAVVIGLLGTLIGIAQAASAIQAAGSVAAPVVWGGIQVALITVIFGLLIFSVALVLWFGLRMGYRRRAELAA